MATISTENLVGETTDEISWIQVIEEEVHTVETSASSLETISPQGVGERDGVRAARRSTLSSEEYEMGDYVSSVSAMDSSKAPSPFCRSLLLFVTASTAALGGILFGYDIGVISGALLQLKTDFHLSCDQQAIVVSFLLLGATIGALLSGFLVDLLGRWVTILLNGVIFVIGSLTIALAQSYYVLVIGRLVLGCAISISAVAECVYISEIAPAKKRGQLVSLNEFGITLGLLISYLVNFLFINIPHGWRYMFGLSAIPAIMQIIGMCFLPKSPRFLMMKGKERQAAKVLKRLHGQALMEEQMNSIRMAMVQEKMFSWKDLFSSKGNMRNRLFLGFGLVIFQQCQQYLSNSMYLDRYRQVFTGQPNILYYAPMVFRIVGFPSDSAAVLATLGLGTVKVAAAIVSLLCVDYWGRRTFLLIGAIAMTLSLLVLSGGSLLQEKNIPSHTLCPGWKKDVDQSPLVKTIISPMASDGNHTLTHYSLSSALKKRALEPSVIPFTHPIKFLCDLRTMRVSREERSQKQFDIRIRRSSNVNDSHNPLLTTNTTPNSTTETSPEVSTGIHVLHVITLLALMTYVGAYAISFGPISWILLSEIYPPAIRGRAVAIVTVINWAANFIVSSTFLHLIDFLHLTGAFLLFAFVSTFSMVFVYFCIPETKNKSLEQITRELSASLPGKQRFLLKKCCPVSRCCQPAAAPYTKVSRDDSISPSREQSGHELI